MGRDSRTLHWHELFWWFWSLYSLPDDCVPFWSSRVLFKSKWNAINGTSVITEPRLCSIHLAHSNPSQASEIIFFHWKWWLLLFSSELGAHIDGFAAMAAHTLVLGASVVCLSFYYGFQFPERNYICFLHLLRVYIYIYIYILFKFITHGISLG